MRVIPTSLAICLQSREIGIKFNRGGDKTPSRLLSLPNGRSMNIVMPLNENMLLTLDANVFHDYFMPSRDQHDAAKSLIQLAADGNFRVQTTTRIANDIPNDTLKSDVAALSVVEHFSAGSAWRIGHTSIENGDAIVSESESQLLDDLFDLIFPNATPNSKHHDNRIADVDHIFAHMKSNADLFISSDGPILKQFSVLNDTYGVVVMTASDIVQGRSWEAGN